MSVFRFKQFYVHQADNAMKVGTDAMVLGALANTDGKQRGLDIGAGTGVLSLMAAQQNSALVIEAIELDELSAKECWMNFDLSPWGDRMKAIHGDFLRHSMQGPYDFIVSNPPYFQTRNENEDERKAAARHESFLPLDEMIEKVSTLLSENGEFWVIYPTELLDDWTRACEQFGLFCSQRVSIYGKESASPNRVVACYTKEERQLKTSTLIVRTNDGKYTAAYITLTNDFHFNDLTK